MSVFDWGTPPITSTQVEVAGGVSTTALIAEIDSTVLGTALLPTGRSKAAHITWTVGGTSNAAFVLEQALSTGLGSTGVRRAIGVYTLHMQSQQFTSRHVLERNDRLRVRCTSTLTSAFATIEAEYLT
jgi:autotransporter adhesin